MNRYVELDTDAHRNGRDVHSVTIVSGDDRFILVYNDHDPEGAVAEAHRVATSLDLPLVNVEH